MPWSPADPGGTTWIPGARVRLADGWASGPTTHHDSLPPVIRDRPRLADRAGSPTTTTCSPSRYHNALFVCDWSRGRILAVKMRRHGATYKASSEVVFGRAAAQRDRHLGRAGRLALLLHRRSRHRRRNLPRGLAGAKCPPSSQAPEGNRRRAEAAAVVECLGPATGGGHQETTRGIGNRTECAAQ